jgi:hypothetical protein
MAKIRFKKSTVAVAAVSIFVFAAAATAALIFLLSGKNNVPKADSQAIVYKATDGGTYLSAYGQKHKLTISDDSSVLLTSDGEYLIYTTASAKVSQKYDLYMCSIKSSSKAKKDAKLLDYGVEKSFKYNDGILYYSKQNPDNLAVMTTAYDLKKNKKSDVDFAIKELFLPSSGDVLYYVKQLSDSQSLYIYSASEGSKELVKNAANIHFYDDGKNCELLFETGSYKEGESELFSVSPGKNPVQTATTVSSVLYDLYSPGGNLYYFVKKESAAGWRDIIDDDMAKDDELIKAPNRNDYTFIFGFSIQYQLDMTKYNRKVSRDKIRQALDEQIKDDTFRQGYNLYARTADGSKKIAENVVPTEVFAVSASGEPSAVFYMTEITGSTVRMSDLDAQLASSSVESVTETAVAAVKACTKKTGFLFADTHFSLPVKLDAYDGKKAEFIIEGNRLFVKSFDGSGDTFSLFKHTLSNGVVSAAEMLDTGVKACSIIGSDMWYRRSVSGSSLCDLYKYSAEKEKIDGDVASFARMSDGSVLIVKNFVSSPDGDIADLYLYDGKKTAPVSEKAELKNMKYSDKGIAFIRSGGDLCIYSKNKLAIIDSDAYNIIAY